MRILGIDENTTNSFLQDMTIEDYGYIAVGAVGTLVLYPLFKLVKCLCC